MIQSLVKCHRIGLGPDPYCRNRAHSGHRLPCQRHLLHHRTEGRDQRVRQCRSGVGALRREPRIQDRAGVHAVRRDRFRRACRRASWSGISRPTTFSPSANFEKIAAATGALNEDDVNRVRQKLGELKLAFGYLADEQTELGFTEDQGTRKRLDEAAAGIEQAINDGMTWMHPGRSREAAAVASHHAPPGSAVPAQPIQRHLGAVLQGIPRFRGDPAPLAGADRAEATACAARAGLRVDAGAMEPLQPEHPAVAQGNRRHQPAAHSAGACDPRDRAGSHQRRRRGARRIAIAHALDHHPGRLRRGSDRAGVSAG